MRIRDARSSDAQPICGLLEELGYPSEPENVVARLRAIASDAASQVFVAEDDSIVGLAMIHVFQPVEHDVPWCQLEALVVTRSHRGRGIGRALVEAAEAEARRRGCGGIVLGTGGHRRDAQGFYARLGYEGVGLRFKKNLIGTSRPPHVED